jgi:hypothetical protein
MTFSLTLKATEVRGLRRRAARPALQGTYGRYIFLSRVPFPYGQGGIEAAQPRGEAVTFRLVRAETKNGEETWYVLATVDRPEA